MREFEKDYMGGDKNERSSLKVKEVYAKMMYQFNDGLKCGRKEAKEKFKELRKRLKKEIKTKGFMNTGINIAFRDLVYDKIDKIWMELK